MLSMMWDTRRLSATAAALLAVFALVRSADATDRGILTLQVENDLMVGEDDGYTSGVRIGYLSPEVEARHLARDLAGRLPLIGMNDKVRFGLALGHNLYTPEDIKRPIPDPNDRPYAAWLYLSFALLGYDDGEEEGAPLGDVETMQRLSLDVGIVGPAALGEQTQNTVHRIIGSPKARGWGSQLRNEPGVVLNYERGWREVFIDDVDLGIGKFDFDVMPHWGAALGNVMTYGSAGSTIRFGQGIKRDFGPPRIRPSLPGSSHFARGDFSWYLFAGAEGRLVARNMFLDGNTFRDSPSVTKHPLVGDFEAGLAINFGTVRLSYTHVVRSPGGPDLKWERFGAVALSFGL